MTELAGWISVGVAVVSLIVTAYMYFKYVAIRQLLQSLLNIIWAAHPDGKQIEDSVSDPQMKLKIQVIRGYIVALHNSITPFLNMTKQRTRPGEKAFYVRIFDTPVEISNRHATKLDGEA